MDSEWYAVNTDTCDSPEYIDQESEENMLTCMAVLEER